MKKFQIFVLASALLLAFGCDKEKTHSDNFDELPPIKNGKTFVVEGVSFNMIKVDGGTFTMGATPEQGADAEYDERPVHQVTLSDYYIGQTEVTQELWEAVMGSNPSLYQKESILPVEQVSWDDIVESFLPRLNALTGKKFTLPTEAQWEFAARGGNKSEGYKYSGSNNLKGVAWCDGNSAYKTHPVGKKAPNELGIYDMTGNVCEWCSDWYGIYTAESQTNPQGPSSGNEGVLRGGCFDCDQHFSHVSCRFVCYPSIRSNDSGFRLALATKAATF